MNSIKGMHPKDQKKITNNLIKIRKTLSKDVTAIAERLVDEGVFSCTVLDEICNVRPALPHLQCAMLINKLMRGGAEAYGVFKKVLEELGYISLVDALENSGNKEDEANLRINDRERTFVIPAPQIPDRLPAVKPHMGSGEVKELERMVTFVMQHFDDTDISSNKQDFGKEFRHKLAKESKENEDLPEFFKTLRYKSFPITNQSCVH